jgi:hypothetical protein
MNVGFNDVLRSLGFGIPLLYAGAIFWLFHYLDKRASGPAKTVIRNWLKSAHYCNAGVSQMILELFDRIYGHPLLSVRSALRSAGISFLITGLVVAKFVLEAHTSFVLLLHPLFIAGFVTNTISDYISLFVVRRLLRFGITRPMWSLFWSALAGMFIVSVFFLVRVELVVFLRGEVAMNLSIMPYVWSMLLLDAVSDLFSHSSRELFLLPALAAHLWLPLLGIAVLFIQFVNSFTRSVIKTQWLIKQGRDHPLEAIGYVAAAVVFVVATVISILGWALS